MTHPRNIRAALIRLAHEDPEIRPAILPVVKSAAWDKLPKGWTQLDGRGKAQGHQVHQEDGGEVRRPRRLLRIVGRSG